LALLVEMSNFLEWKEYDESFKFQLTAKG